MGTLLREGRDRLATVKVIDDRHLVTVGIKSPLIEFFHFYNQKESDKKRTKRLKKYPESSPELILKDLIKRGECIKAAEAKIKSIDPIVRDDFIQV